MFFVSVHTLHMHLAVVGVQVMATMSGRPAATRKDGTMAVTMVGWKHCI